MNLLSLIKLSGNVSGTISNENTEINIITLTNNATTLGEAATFNTPLMNWKNASNKGYVDSANA